MPGLMSRYLSCNSSNLNAARERNPFCWAILTKGSSKCSASHRLLLLLLAILPEFSLRPTGMVKSAVSAEAAAPRTSLPQMTLSTRQKKHLRGLTHGLQPVVIVGDKGLTDNVLAEVAIALEHHELVKIKLRADRAHRAAMIDEIAQRCEAETVHVIGQVACFFKRNPENPRLELPR